METICQAVTFPFFPHSLKWKELDAMLLKSWKASTKLANWAMSQLYLVDSLTMDQSSDKIDSMPNVDLYGLAFTRKTYQDHSEWEGAKSCANSILRAVSKSYAAKRYEIVWRRSCSLPSIKYPFPYPVHNKDWKPFYGDGNIPLVSLPLPGGRVVLRMKGGQEWHRQLRKFDQLVSGCKRCEAAIYRKKDRCMIKLVGHFPKPTAKSPDRIMVLSTDPNAFWVAEVDGRQAWVHNADHVKRLIQKHDCTRQRFGEDLKFERRHSKRDRRNMKEALEKRCEKVNSRLDSFIHESTAMVANFAARSRCGLVVYNDNVKTYLPHFPWFVLREKLRYKLDARGIQLSCSESGESGNE